MVLGQIGLTCDYVLSGLPAAIWVFIYFLASSDFLAADSLKRKNRKVGEELEVELQQQTVLYYDDNNNNNYIIIS